MDCFVAALLAMTEVGGLRRRHQPDGVIVIAEHALLEIGIAIFDHLGYLVAAKLEHEAIFVVVALALFLVCTSPRTSATTKSPSATRLMARARYSVANSANSGFNSLSRTSCCPLKHFDQVLWPGNRQT